MNVLPLPTALCSFSSPPSRPASSRLIASPSPVPPYLRDVPASACWNASNTIRCLSGEMPMPVSVTSSAITIGALSSTVCPGVQPSCATLAASRTLPSSVNLNALDSRFLRICCRRLGSVLNELPSALRKIDDEFEIAPIGLVPERALDIFAQVREGDFLAVDRDRSGFDLRKIEDVADQMQQVGAGRMDRLGEFDFPVGKRSSPDFPPAAGRGSGCC